MLSGELKFRVSFPIDVLVSTCPCRIVAQSTKLNVKNRCNAQDYHIISKQLDLKLGWTCWILLLCHCHVKALAR